MNDLTRVILRLGRNPEAGFPNGSDEYGYVIHAPLDDDNKLDKELWRARRRDCTVRRFKPDEAPADGWLRYGDGDWYFWYDEEDEGPPETFFKLGAHELRPGELITVREGERDTLTYRVTEATRL